MKLNSHTYFTGKEEGKRVVIDINRDAYVSNGLGKLLKEWLGNLEVGGKVALLYAAGPAIHHSDARDIKKAPCKEGTIVVKSQVGYSVYELARMCKFEIDFISINTNTCASSMYSLYEAKGLIEKGYTDVIVLSADLVDETQELLFEQLGIDLVCGDGVVGLHLTADRGNVEISDVVWKWNRDSSPMSITKEGYLKVLRELDTKDVDIVKTHGSGTERNTVEELAAINEVLPNVRCVEYKSVIGHTQGASAGIELGMLVDKEEWKKAVVLASGLGGFYGGCILRK